MGDRLERLFGRGQSGGEIEPLGEDMAPSPIALAERSALSGDVSSTVSTNQGGPFSSSVQAPVRDFEN